MFEFMAILTLENMWNKLKLNFENLESTFAVD